MKRFRVMAAALCAAVLLCGFSVPAYAYADGGEGRCVPPFFYADLASRRMPMRTAARARTMAIPP